MSLNAAHYREQLAALLPKGAAWETARQADEPFYQLLSGLAEEPARFQEFLDNILDELDPRTTTNLLPEWQKMLGLPDGCLTASSLQEWRNLLHAQLTATGGASLGYFKALATRLGYFITIDEYYPFRADMSEADDPLNDDDLPFTWTVNVVTPALIFFRADESLADEPLEYSTDTLIECLFNRLKPAHTILEVNYLVNVLTDENGAPILDSSGNFILVEI